MSTCSVLYVTYDGICDHVGQSQVAPYLIELAALGHRITILSAEKAEKQDLIQRYAELLREKNIDWHYVPYHKKPPILSTVWDLYRMRQLTAQLIRRNKVTIIHCRSYPASLIGLHFKKRNGVKFIFDMRDFWPDDCRETKRFDVNNNLIHRAVYTFFKMKEKDFLECADQIISLTEAGKRIMEDWTQGGAMKITAPIAVIPCCADFSLFDPARLDPRRLDEVRRTLGLAPGDFVLTYLGSLSPARQLPTCLIDEMLDFFAALQERRPAAKFLIVANDNHQVARDAALRKGLDPDKLIIIRATREEVPYLIAQGQLSVFFYIPCFARKASSPIKLAELLAMNKPIVSNTGIGDVDAILDLEVNRSAVVVRFDKDEYLRVIDRLLGALNAGPVNIRDNSRAFSLPVGVQAYHEAYERLKTC